MQTKQLSEQKHRIKEEKKLAMEGGDADSVSGVVRRSTFT